MTTSSHRYVLHIEQEPDQPQVASSLAVEMAEILGVTEVARKKLDASTMDLGQIVELVATSGATLAIAQGLSDWIRRHRGVKLVIERTSDAGSIKASIENADSQTALAVTEMVLRQDATAS